MSWVPVLHRNNTQEVTVEWVRANHPSDQFQLLDCREQPEWNAGHIEGAIFCPLSQWHSVGKAVSKEKPIVVYCRSGKRSARATNDLLAKGYQVASMAGGISAYE